VGELDDIEGDPAIILAGEIEFNELLSPCANDPLPVW